MLERHQLEYLGFRVTVAMDPRTVGTQIDDSMMDKNLDAKLISTNKKVSFKC